MMIGEKTRKRSAGDSGDRQPSIAVGMDPSRDDNAEHTKQVSARERADSGPNLEGRDVAAIVMILMVIVATAGCLLVVSMGVLP